MTASASVSSQFSAATLAVAQPRRRARRLAALIVGVIASGVFVWLGTWQLDRAAFKAGLLARHHAATGAALLSLPTVADAARIDALRVQVSGVWLADRTVWIDNRTHGGRAGVHLLTPLRFADGSVLFVNRGWAPLPGDRTQLPQVPLAAGTVRLSGLAQLPNAGGFTLAGADARPELWSRITPERLARHLPGARLYPQVLELDTDLNDGLIRDWVPATQGPDRHRAYALQWFSFAAIAAALTLFWAWRSFRRDET